MTEIQDNQGVLDTHAYLLGCARLARAVLAQAIGDLDGPPAVSGPAKRWLLSDDLEPEVADVRLTYCWMADVTLDGVQALARRTLEGRAPQQGAPMLGTNTLTEPELARKLRTGVDANR